MVGNFHTTFLVIDKYIDKNQEGHKGFNNIISKPPIDIHSVLYSAMAECTLFQKMHSIFTKFDYMLRSEANLSNVQKIQIKQRIF